MSHIKLIGPELKHKGQIRDFIEEHIRNGEHHLHGGALIETMPYEDWLIQLKNNSDIRTVNPNWVVSSTYFAMIGEKIIGIIDIRHTLNQFLKDFGGHIGYGVRPSERGKGYATEMLKLALGVCIQLNLDNVMLACYKDNPASRSVIEKCGGKLENQVEAPDGKLCLVYWINI
ncbi:MAG: GNAT family N-acetyltransferase [Clostridiales bacterium]|nr:GNAT family N-acetyltransferase [Clostridiales bacterium]